MDYNVSFFYISTSILICAITVITVYYKRAFNYWKNRKVPYCPPSIPAGNIGNCLIGKKSLGDIVANIYNDFKSQGFKHGGFYFLSSPVYMPMDPDCIKNILIKDFQHFVDRGIYFDEQREPLSAHLFALEGAKWKNIRNKMSPTFTSGKMKMMFQTLVDSSVRMIELCENYVKDKESMDVKDVFARLGTDVICSCAFGIDSNSIKNPDSEIRKIGKEIFDVDIWQGAKNFISVGFPQIIKFLRLQVQKKHVSAFFYNMFAQSVNYREKNNITRNDFLHLLLQLKNEGYLHDDGMKNKVETTLTFNEIAAQAFVFFIAGFETTSTTITFCLFELAQNLDIQSKLRDEIHNVLEKHDGKFSYDTLNEMNYLHTVVNETLRKYPPVQFLNRICTKKYEIPKYNLTLEKGTPVYISVSALHMDPEYFPNPDVFDPERFNEENKANIHSGVYLPFGDGPRNCVGFRFGLMQSKLAVAILLNKFIVTLNSKTQLPLIFSPTSFVLAPIQNIWLDIQKA